MTTAPMTREQADLVRVWRERFGEPPAILAEAELLRAVLEACGRKDSEEHR